MKLQKLQLANFSDIVCGILQRREGESVHVGVVHNPVKKTVMINMARGPDHSTLVLRDDVLTHSVDDIRSLFKNVPFEP